MKKYIPFLLLLILASCQESFYYSDSKAFDEDAWGYQDSLEFKVNIADTTTHFDLMLDLIHSADYPFQNIYVYINTQFPNGKRFGKEVNIDLANKLGVWQGKCSGDWCNVRVNLQQNAFFNETGDYTFTLKQYMRTDTLQGIRKVGFNLRALP